MLPSLLRPSSSQTKRRSALSAGYTLLETLVALAVLIVLTMVVLAIYRHHTTPPPVSEVPLEAPKAPAGTSAP